MERDDWYVEMIGDTLGNMRIILTYETSNPGTAEKIKAFFKDLTGEKRGKWLPREEGKVYPFWERYTCSVCGEHASDTNYCPNCGARMDEE